MRYPSRDTATTRPTTFSTVTAWSPPGDESHQREYRDRGGDEGQVGHRELLIDVRNGIGRLANTSKPRLHPGDKPP